VIITFFRSSSYNTFGNCEMQYYLGYVLSKENRSGIKACIGNISHKALEWLACYKKCLQDGTTSFIDDGLGEITIEDCKDVDKLLLWSYEYYKKIEPYHAWDDDKHFKDCVDVTYQALNFQKGLFDPRNRKVVMPEQKFDFEIKQDWAKYSYDLGDDHLEGYLRLKGTMDLITEVRPGIFEMIDWKTGATKKDFGSGKEKDFDSLHYDPQLRLYHYAAHHLFPEIDNIMVTIYFIRLDFPCTVMLSKADLSETERMIEKQFNKVRNTLVPDLTPGPTWADRRRPAIANYKCYKLCNFANPSVEDPSISTCQYMKEQIEQKGIQQVTEEHATLYTIGSYGTGGGRVAETPEATKD